MFIVCLNYCSPRIQLLILTDRKGSRHNGFCRTTFVLTVQLSRFLKPQQCYVVFLSCIVRIILLVDLNFFNSDVLRGWRTSLRLPFSYAVAFSSLVMFSQPNDITEK